MLNNRHLQFFGWIPFVKYVYDHNWNNLLLKVSQKCLSDIPRNPIWNFSVNLSQCGIFRQLSGTKQPWPKKRTFILSKSCFSQKAFSLWEQQQQLEWWHFKYNHLEKKRENRLLSLAALLASGLLQILGKGHHQIRQGFQKN